MASNNQQTILVAEDQNDNLVLVSLWLQNLGYLVLTAANGESAVEVAKIARPNLILMDISMPVMDGLEATRAIRQTPEISDLPIIFLTAFDTKEFPPARGRRRRRRLPHQALRLRSPQQVDTQPAAQRDAGSGDESGEFSRQHPG